MMRRIKTAPKKEMWSFGCVKH